MKLLIAITQSRDAARVSSALSGIGLSVTRLQSAGAYLGSENATLLVGLHESQVDVAIRLIRENCRERSELMPGAAPLPGPGEAPAPFQVQVEVAGATVFVVDVERFERV